MDKKVVICELCNRRVGFVKYYTYKKKYYCEQCYNKMMDKIHHSLKLAKKNSVPCFDNIYFDNSQRRIFSQRAGSLLYESYDNLIDYTSMKIVKDNDYKFSLVTVGTPLYENADHSLSIQKLRINLGFRDGIQVQINLFDHHRDSEILLKNSLSKFYELSDLLDRIKNH